MSRETIYSAGKVGMYAQHLYPTFPPLPNQPIHSDNNTGAGTGLLVAHPNFRILATMNPGGDYGKRELSPALRSRFTEIWVPPLRARADVEAVVVGALAAGQGRMREEGSVSVSVPRLAPSSLGWLAGEFELSGGLEGCCVKGVWSAPSRSFS